MKLRLKKLRLQARELKARGLQALRLQALRLQIPRLQIPRLQTLGLQTTALRLVALASAALMAVLILGGIQAIARNGMTATSHSPSAFTHLDGRSQASFPTSIPAPIYGQATANPFAQDQSTVQSTVQPTANAPAKPGATPNRPAAKAEGKSDSVHGDRANPTQRENAQPEGNPTNRPTANPATNSGRTTPQTRPNPQSSPSPQNSANPQTRPSPQSRPNPQNRPNAQPAARPAPARPQPQQAFPVIPLPLQQASGSTPKLEAAPADATNFGDRYSTDVFGNPVSNALLVVLHETVGSADSAINTIKTRHPRDEDQVSYHSVVRRNGTIVFLVPFEKRAFGAGNSVYDGPNGPETVRTHPSFPPSVNNFAYHISLETPSDGANSSRTHSGYTSDQYASLAWLTAWTRVPDERIVTHKEIDQSGSRMDPRSFDRDRFLQLVDQYPRG